ncbi:carbamoyl-phosphate synthase large subunit [Ethanoligenens harbinense]|uniref:Carbamoyl phosphate synthase large chain n=1 Tax=Ethanoligenens harbinense (strain DSM 18485 / JCM 12961 / CGMCC 1.5033 / YUAN-3) TaxID=663278 RepID=E6U5E1_ETHHY|nr:carbamoyl-phosphate synthase large subunit [Ethanoligenens harbinense]ADU25608.1 carbamoyl-phosphate synthase, large subunit [Ethanoligenens harbinense YUAN-3]AVQ94784.1 carbamoyl-phosphate synthase large subunit [Ethanoligenens harbinense YUAN-3]AYF37476.1 carbamoyl-phosphate synthase large subunit [Ethanoligenens harbinense]AYF40195.1 carbamoyl-phosphate synthase large subunit [Ethanoligenens harbinense]QCN91031.1 carbamoyl-phosphate synthase large subunit [Ethanoligenens harbinense]
MPKNPDIHKVLVIGSGPIVIGQAAEFDYAGTQACRALREEGIEVVLVNSNPATIMTDKLMADKIYIEPLTPEVVERIIEIEKPDSILPTLGGQTGLNLAMQIAEEGFLEKAGVKLLGTRPETIRKAEDRQAFKDTMEAIGEPCIASEVVESIEGAVAFSEKIGYPVIIRPAYTLGGSGGGIAETKEELVDIATNGLRLSRIHQILVEKCIAGWKEIEYEVIRDALGNVITVCNMENIDPVGIHTGDSIVVAPSQTLSDKDYQMLRSASLNIISALGVEGGCNVQLALHPDSYEYAVIEVNPRVSRSSALASKATGYPIAKVAAKIAIGYTLDEIKNAVTGKTYACFEPALDYCVVKFPKWPFDKFVYARRTLGTQMMATGEVMAIGNSFELAMMKAVRSIELKLTTLSSPKLAEKTDGEIRELLHNQDDERIFVVYEAIKRGISADDIFAVTKIDRWFLAKFAHLASVEQGLQDGALIEERYLEAKKCGFLDGDIERLSGQKIPQKRHAVYKMVDTCAAEFAAETPYFYSTWDEENEAAQYLDEHKNGKKKVLVFGSGPIRIGQGIEFDYCSVHSVWALRENGYEAVIVNNNPETVSTDFDTGDRLYFDPLTPEDVDNIIATEQPWGVVVQFGGQTAIKLANHLAARGVRILGTSADGVDEAEDRERFDAVLEKCGIPRPAGHTALTAEEALEAARALGYPVLLRPSYVLGGQNMIIAYADTDVTEYMGIITAHGIDNPVLIDKYLMGKEVEVDAICDGEDILVPGIMEHIERAGVHSGDSISVYPAQTLSAAVRATVLDYTEKLAKALKVIGMVNIQFVVYNETVYVIEVNPRSSRTVPYISKVTGVPMIDLATHCMLGQKLKDLGYGTGLWPEGGYVAVKVPVFSFAKLHGVDTLLGPEMKSTGEVLGIAKTFDEALLKGLTAAGYRLKGRHGNVLFTVKDSDKQEIIPLAEKFARLGYTLYATAGTALTLNSNMVAANTVRKLGEPEPNIGTLLDSGKIDYVISTATTGRAPQLDDVRIRRKTVERSIPCLTSLDTASALLSCLEMEKSMADVPLVDIAHLERR